MFAQEFGQSRDYKSGGPSYPMTPQQPPFGGRMGPPPGMAPPQGMGYTSTSESSNGILGKLKNFFTGPEEDYLPSSGNGMGGMPPNSYSGPASFGGTPAPSYGGGFHKTDSAQSYRGGSPPQNMYATGSTPATSQMNSQQNFQSPQSRPPFPDGEGDRRFNAVSDRSGAGAPFERWPNPSGRTSGENEAPGSFSPFGSSSPASTSRSASVAPEGTMRPSYGAFPQQIPSGQQEAFGGQQKYDQQPIPSAADVSRSLETEKMVDESTEPQVIAMEDCVVMVLRPAELKRYYLSCLITSDMIEDSSIAIS